ncbi:hypothetical protein HYFRA_00001312 [Hymenoscyphus fraxineus]|uniref:RNase H type-1 domain-containing protein n=1 Tax=Hymenoscyphus fraxineus TaxID=746836 RepID=A0A9N9L4N7_9HELO|nr:hypothetical protein HYFRA_00001312 [Hymenoscyphus fraxineus]
MATQAPLDKNALRRARRAHEREQFTLEKHKLPTCPGCNLCSLTQARGDRPKSKPKPWPTPNPPKPKPQGPQIQIPLKDILRSALFRGTVTKSTKAFALEAATQDCNNRTLSGHGRGIYWTHGVQPDNESIQNSDARAGIGLVRYSNKDDEWIERSWRPRKPIKSEDELQRYTIAQALYTAWEDCREINEEERPKVVCIYIATLSALKTFIRFQTNLHTLGTNHSGLRQIAAGIFASEQLISLGIEVELRLIPARSNIEGHVKAKQAAEAARNGAIHSIGDCINGQVVMDKIRVGHYSSGNGSHSKETAGKKGVDESRLLCSNVKLVLLQRSLRHNKYNEQQL